MSQASDTTLLFRGDAAHRDTEHLAPTRHPPAPAEADSLHPRAVRAWRDGHLPAALELIDAALRQRGAPAAWLVTRGMVLRDLGRRDEALLSLDDAVAGDPGLAPAHAMRGVLLALMDRPIQALASLDRAVALRPDDFDLVRSRAVLLAERHRPHEALADFEHAAALPAPDETARAMVHVDRAEVLRGLGRPLEALAAYDAAIGIREDLAAAWHGKGLLLLSLGRFDEGWPLHEWRWFVPGFPGGDRLFAQPMWDGTPLAGRTLLVHAEQGFGDTLQFLRFVAAAGREGRVLLEIPDPLRRLVAAQPWAPPLVPGDGGGQWGFDRHCPMMSLPFLLGAGLSAAPYLRADPRDAAHWAGRLSASAGKFRVGIVWSGNARYGNDRNRSLPLDVMLAMIPAGATIVPLQKDISASDQTALRRRADVVDTIGSQADFADAAAMIANLDLVVSVDTAVAHLAGAMGKPVWIALASLADWRWMTDRGDSPWYPTARLFRQDAPGDWGGVARRVRRALEEFLVPA